jgi:hypothetical protein
MVITIEIQAVLSNQPRIPRKQRKMPEGFGPNDPPRPSTARPLLSFGGPPNANPDKRGFNDVSSLISPDKHGFNAVSILVNVFSSLINAVISLINADSAPIHAVLILKHAVLTLTHAV